MLHYLVKEQTLCVLGVKCDALTGRISSTTVINTTLQRSSGLLVCCLVVGSGDNGVTGNTAERIPDGVTLGTLLTGNLSEGYFSYFLLEVVRRLVAWKLDLGVPEKL
jgi:hypothetical protein